MTFYQIFRLDVLLQEFIDKLEKWESEFEVDQAVDDIRVTIDGIVDNVVDYATWDSGDIDIINQVSFITDALEKAMTNIPELDNLFDPTVISPISDTLVAMKDYADGSYPSVVSATENLISDLDNLLVAADDCASEATGIKSYIETYIDEALEYNETTIDDLVVNVVDLAEGAVDYVNTTGRESVLAVYDDSTSGWFNLTMNVPMTAD